MLANEIIANLQKVFFKDHFAGIFASDRIPKHIKNKHFIIINTDPSSLPGRHWFVLVRINNVLEYFDSLGVKTEHVKQLMIKVKTKGVKSLTFNSSQIQPLSSTLCGEYVLYYLFERFHNLDMNFDDLLNQIFTDELSKNDENVLHFMKEILNNGNTH